MLSRRVAQIDQFEAEIETLGSKKKSKKSRDNTDEIEEYQGRIV